MSILYLLLILFALFVFAGWFFINQTSDKLIAVRKKYSSSFRPEEYLAPDLRVFQKHFYTTNDQQKLCTAYFPAVDSGKNHVIIFIHGIRFGKEFFYSQASRLASEGYHCLVPDLRAHGESSGNYCTFGYYEKGDIIELLNFAETILNLPGEFSVWGHSMGASIAIQCMAVESRIKFGIMEAPFSSLEKISVEYMHRNMPFLPLKLITLALKYAGHKANFEPEKINPAHLAKKISRPVMFIHGTKDDRIDMYHSVQIYNALPGDNKIFFEVRDADHHNVPSIWGDEYFEITTAFVKKNSSLYEYS